MSSIERGNCYTQYKKGTKCSRLFCKREAVYRQLTYPLFGFSRYMPVCEKHIRF